MAMPPCKGWRVGGRAGRPALAMGEKTSGAAQRRCAVSALSTDGAPYVCDLHMSTNKLDCYTLVLR